MKKITRKSFFQKGSTLLAASALGSACTSGPASQASSDPSVNIQTQKRYNWKMVTTWPPNFPVLGEGCNLFAQWVNEMSGGRMTIDVYGAGELVPAYETFETVSNGVVELGNGAAYYWAGKIPTAQFFATVPFGLNAQQMNAWILSGGGLALWEELYAPFNLIPMPSGNTGVQMGGWFNKEINSLQDIRGLKMRIPGLGGKVFSEAGGTALNVAGGEIYTNLERGVIDATEWIGPYHDYKMGFHEIAKYYYYPGWHEPGTTLETFVHKGKFDSLPKDLQHIIRVAALRQNTWTLSEFEAQNSVYLDRILNESDVSLRPFPQQVLSRYREITREVIQDLVSQDPRAEKIYASYEKFRNGAQVWSELTEKIFYNQIQGKPDNA